MLPRRSSETLLERKKVEKTDNRPRSVSLLLRRRSRHEIKVRINTRGLVVAVQTTFLFSSLLFEL